MALKVVLAYSGGLDTSIIVPWLRENYDAEVVCFAADVGQGEELDGLDERARRQGAARCVVADLREEFVREAIWPTLRAGAIYARKYLLGTAMARPLIARHQAELALELGANALAHGCTGKGNDQVRFELTYMALGPDLKIIAPWKDPSFELTSREAAVDYAKAKNVPIAQSKEKIYSRDRNLWHCSHEGAEIEHPEQRVRDDVWLMSRPLAETPAEPETVTLDFDRGTPVAVNGEKLPGHKLIAALNDRGGRHAVGQVVMVENRLVGMKSRGAYETPGGTILYEAHKALEQIALERDTLHFKQQAALRYAELVYYGQWFHPLREALQSFFDATQKHISGRIKLELFKGHARTIGVEPAPGVSLYDPKLASFAMDGYDVTAARGFIDLFGLPMKVANMRDRK